MSDEAEWFDALNAKGHMPMVGEDGELDVLVCNHGYAARTFDALWKAVGDICALFNQANAEISSGTPDMRLIKRPVI